MHDCQYPWQSSNWPLIRPSPGKTRGKVLCSDISSPCAVQYCRPAVHAHRAHGTNAIKTSTSVRQPKYRSPRNTKFRPPTIRICGSILWPRFSEGISTEVAPAGRAECFAEDYQQSKSRFVTIEKLFFGPTFFCCITLYKHIYYDRYMTSHSSFSRPHVSPMHGAVVFLPCFTFSHPPEPPAKKSKVVSARLLPR
jgi:hypothetical protein